MNNEEHIKELNCEISKLKEQLLLTENELNETKHKLNTYQTNSKKYYENNLIYDDLFVPFYIKKCRRAFGDLTRILKLGDIYPHQIK